MASRTAEAAKALAVNSLATDILQLLSDGGLLAAARLAENVVAGEDASGWKDEQGWRCVPPKLRRRRVPPLPAAAAAAADAAAAAAAADGRLFTPRSACWTTT